MDLTFINIVFSLREKTIKEIIQNYDFEYYLKLDIARMIQRNTRKNIIIAKT